MSDHQTYTEVLARNNEVLEAILSCLREGRSVSQAGIIESQLDHVIRAAGELKGEVAHNREMTQHRFDRLQGDISEIKQKCCTMAQWQSDHEGRCERMDVDLDNLRGRINKLAAGNGALSVLAGVVASLIGANT